MMVTPLLLFAIAHVGVTLSDISGASVSVPAPKAVATVLFFVGTDCPISNRLAPYMAEIQKVYSAKKISINFVYPDRETTREEVVTHMKRYKLAGTAIIDQQHALVKFAKASLTPEAFIFRPDGTLAYHGRINDMYAEHNRPRNDIRRHDVKIALDEMLAGRPVSHPYQPSIGCSIVMD
jgi:hypothetical protein